MSKIDELLQEVRTELSGDFIATDIVGSDGMSIAGASASPNFDSTAACARLAMVMKLSSKVSDKLALGGVQENMATTDASILLARYLGDGSYFWMMAIPKDATLGSVRMVMNEYADQLWDAIPH